VSITFWRSVPMALTTQSLSRKKIAEAVSEALHSPFSCPQPAQIGIAPRTGSWLIAAGLLAAGGGVQAQVCGNFSGQSVTAQQNWAALVLPCTVSFAWNQTAAVKLTFGASGETVSLLPPAASTAAVYITGTAAPANTPYGIQSNEFVFRGNGSVGVNTTSGSTAAALRVDNTWGGSITLASGFSFAATGAGRTAVDLRGGAYTLTVQAGAAITAANGATALTIGGTSSTAANAPDQSVVNYGLIGGDGTNITALLSAGDNFGNSLNYSFVNFGQMRGQLVQPATANSRAWRNGPIRNQPGGVIGVTDAGGSFLSTATFFVDNRSVSANEHNSYANSQVFNLGTIYGTFAGAAGRDLFVNGGTVNGAVDFGTVSQQKGTYAARPGEVLNGQVRSAVGTPSAPSAWLGTLALSGGTGENGTFDLSNLGAYDSSKPYQGVGYFLKQGPATWTLTASGGSVASYSIFRSVSGVATAVPPTWNLLEGRLIVDPALVPWRYTFGAPNQWTLGAATLGDTDYWNLYGASLNADGSPRDPTAGPPRVAVLELRTNGNTTYNNAIGEYVVGVVANDNCATLFSPISLGNMTGAGANCAWQTSGSVEKTGSGRLVLENSTANANNYTGGTTITAGVLAIGSDTLLGAAAGGLRLNGGTLEATASFTSARPITLAASSGVDTDVNALTLTGVLSGPGSLTKAGAGTLSLSGANSYSGSTTVNGGTLTLSGNGSIANSSGLTLAATGASFDITGITAATAIQSLDGVTGSSVALGDKSLSVGTGNYAGSIGGSASGSLTKLGTGTLSLTGDSSGFAGSSSVSAGTLRVDGSLGTAGASLTVASGAVLTGTGTVGGSSTVQGGGTLNPGGASPGTLNFGNLTLQSGAILNYRLNTPNTPAGGSNDRIDVAGNLTLGGATLNVSSSATDPSGVYRIFNYGGSLSGTGLAVGSRPASTAAATLLYAPGQVNLLLANSGQLVQFWDGANLTGSNGTVDGGSGTWNAANANWTDASGNANGAWGGGVGIFSTQGGTVSVQGAQAFQGLQFTADGYSVVAGAAGSLTLSGDVVNPAASFVNVDAGVTATLALPLAGSQGLDKLGAGKLTLSGSNSYSGGTTITQGRLAIGADAALGAAGGALRLAGGSLQTEGDISMQRSVEVAAASGIDTATGILTLGSGLAGSGALLKSGSGTLALAAPGTYTGELTLAAGTLALEASDALGSGRLRTTGSTVAYADGVTNAAPILLASNGTQLQVASGSATQSGAISADTGARPLEKTGAGTLVLTGSNSYGGPTTISAGTLVANTANLPGDVDIRGTLRFVQPTDAGYAGRISGNGQWIKEGTGTLSYSGDGTAFIGATQVAAGTLVVNQGLGGSIAVASGATLTGSGQVGSLQLAGSIAPAGSSIGTLTVAGDLTVAAGSTYQVQLRPSTQPVAGSDNDLIAVQGQTTLQGGVIEIDPLAGRYRGRVRYTLLTSDGGVSGQFAGINTTLPVNSLFARYALGYDADEVWLDISAGDIAASAATVNQRAVGAALDREFLAGPGPLDPLYTALFALPDATSAQAAYDSLSGEVHASALQGVQQTNRAFEQTVATRLRSGRGGSWLSAPAADAPAAGSDGLWVAPIIAGSTVDGDGNASGGQMRDYGVALGYDQQIGEALRAGLALGGNNARTRLDRSNAGSASYDGFQIGAYLSWRPQRWRVDGQIYGGQQWLRSSRTVAVGSSVENYSASYQVPALGAAVEAAWRLPLDGPVALAPFAGAAYQQLWRPAATESAGALGAQLALAGQQASTAPLWLGLESELPVDAAGWRGAVGLRLGWVGQLGSTDNGSEASFALAPATTAMTVYGVPQARSSALVGLRLDLARSGGTQFVLEYSGIFGGGISSNTGRLAVSWAF
jgi:autotransporter-associated beta strand protein